AFAVPDAAADAATSTEPQVAPPPEAAVAPVPAFAVPVSTATTPPPAIAAPKPAVAAMSGGDADAAVGADVAAERAGPDTVPMPEPAPSVFVHASPAAASPFDTARQWFLGGNTIVKAGVAILFVGLAFLAKYAAEHTQVPV